MLPLLTASAFHRPLNSGRNRPVICTCRSPDGRNVGDFVVKLSGSETGVRGLEREAIGSLLAVHFQIPTPSPAIVQFPHELATAIAESIPGLAPIIRRSTAPHFGSRLADGAPVWPVDGAIPAALREQAARIFAFDALIQNPDRRHSNPNLLFKGGSFLAIDHELAFSFLDLIVPQVEPWRVAEADYLRDHALFRRLNGGTIELERFAALLTAFNTEGWQRIVAAIPGEWRVLDPARIAAHLFAVQSHADQFVEDVERMLV